MVNTGAALALLLRAVGRDLARFGRWSLSLLRARRRDGSPATTEQTPTGVDVDLPPQGETLPASSRTPRRRRVGRRIAIVAGTLAVGLIAATIGLMVWALHDVPLERIASGRVDNQAISLVAAGGEPLIQRGPYREASATLDQFPESLVQAVLAIEDRRFYDHWGMDLWGIGRALTRNFVAGEIREGGSTITQQLLKILYLEPDRALRRKVQELFLSLWLESRLSKDEILTLYLNNVYLGAGATGMPAAARVYFDKAVNELTVAESALLAGLIASPSALNPLENLEGARERAAAVLRAMQSAGFLDDAAAAEAQLNSAQLQPRRPEFGTGTWFADWAMQDAQEMSGQFLGNVKVTTTLVPALQTIAEQSVRTVMEEQGAGSGAGQAAMVVLGPDGAVLAMVGGLDYGESQFNRALALRQPGSTFKLFTYYAALKLGAAPDTRLEDRPIEIDGWTPENFDGEYSGRVSLAEAFARSLNVASVYLGMEVGLPNIVAAARELGIDASLRETPSLILGASEVSLLDLTGAYASIRAGMAPIEPYGIATFEAANGRPFTIGPRVEPSQSLDAVHGTMVGLLQLVVERGTGQAAMIDRIAAGKTGTSQDYRDAWFVGFDENYTVGVWVGNDDSSPMDGVTGGRLPAMMWQRFMTDAVPPQGSAAEAPFGAENQPASAPLQCNIQACSRAYRSFRASDCTFQPYSGPRRICEK
nr:PBP1A family penicillin-binding protein [Devosia nitrariae]